MAQDLRIVVKEERVRSLVLKIEAEFKLVPKVEIPGRAGQVVLFYREVDSPTKFTQWLAASSEVISSEEWQRWHRLTPVPNRAYASLEVDVVSKMDGDP